NIIFFQETAAATFKPSLTPATVENKSLVSPFLEKTSPHGQTDPIPGLQKAFDQHPQLVFLLTDGDFPDNDLVIKWIAEHNKDHKIKINTIAYISDAGEDPEKVLRTIAEKNGGVFKKVTQEDIN